MYHVLQVVFVFVCLFFCICVLLIIVPACWIHLFLPDDLFFFLEIISFEDEPGKQVRSAVRIKNTSKSNVAFKVMKFRFLLMFMFFVVFTCNAL